MKNKKTKYRIKNCEDCAYWNSPERFNPREFCASHRDLEDQPPGIDKRIKKVKRELRKERMFYGIFALINMIMLLVLPIRSKNYFFMVIGGIFLIMIISLIITTEKDAREELKELYKKKNEWIIEYE